MRKRQVNPGKAATKNKHKLTAKNSQRFGKTLPIMLSNEYPIKPTRAYQMPISNKHQPTCLSSSVLKNKNLGLVYAALAAIRATKIKIQDSKLKLAGAMINLIRWLTWHLSKAPSMLPGKYHTTKQISRSR